eukprot:2017726-Rhodomonas_salina.2
MQEATIAVVGARDPPLALLALTWARITPRRAPRASCSVPSSRSRLTKAVLRPGAGWRCDMLGATRRQCRR